MDYVQSSETKIPLCVSHILVFLYLQCFIILNVRGILLPKDVYNIDELLWNINGIWLIHLLCISGFLGMYFCLGNNFCLCWDYSERNRTKPVIFVLKYIARSTVIILMLFDDLHVDIWCFSFLCLSNEDYLWEIQLSDIWMEYFCWKILIGERME